MKKALALLNIGLFCALIGITTPSIADLPPAKQDNQSTTSLAPMLKQIIPAVVNISVRGQLPMMMDPFVPEARQSGLGPKFEGMGSGVIVSGKKGYILTNAHVVRDAKYITVTLNDGRHYPAKLIGADDASDIAVIQIQATNLHAVDFGNSNRLEVGDYVVAIGSPFDLKQSVTSGIISALGRSGLGIEGYEDFIQTDAPINPGNSGGALVDLQGHLIGINTAILSANGASIGIGFAIPSNMALNVMTQLIKYGDVERGMVGVMVQDLTPPLASAFHLPEDAEGALVTSVSPNSPAEKAGIQIGDIIQQAGGESVKNATQLRNTVGLTRVGQTIKIVLYRQGKSQTISVTSEDPDKIKQKTLGNLGYFSGIRMQDFNEWVPSRGQVSGVGVLAVADSSAAWNDGLRRGDVIIEVNNQPVKSLSELVALSHSLKNPPLIQVLRGTGAVFLVLQ